MFRNKKLRSIQVQSLKNQEWIAKECYVADSFLSRAVGLIGTKSLDIGEGLLIKPCRTIAMWFMSIPIDIVFVQQDASSNHLKVTSIYRDVQPWAVFALGDRKASQTLELPVGTIQRCKIEAGDTLCIS